MRRQGGASRPAAGIGLRVPVLFLVLAATAVPIELRAPGRLTLDFRIYTADFLANIAGFAPVGIVLAEFGFLRAIAAALLLSVFAETGQLVMAHRDPSVADVAANVIGAILGAVIGSRWRLRSPAFRINRAKALAAAVLAVALIGAVRAASGSPLNPRGASAPGTLEAQWKFDDCTGPDVEDSSGHGLRGRFRGQPARTPGVRGSAVSLDGARDYIDFGRSSAFRLTGSMTITAWINPASFPPDDAAIVSQFQNGAGYQLDTTVDRGPRTIGFKLTNACGKLMARYGATPLAPHTWYHAAGVYNAEAQRLDVYLNGELDNDFLLGPVTSTQHSSRASVYIGRRRDRPGYEFAGSIDDVRIYSFALTRAQIAAAMRGEPVPAPDAQPAAGAIAPCAVLSDPEDAKLPAVAAVLGVLAAVASIGLWPSARPPLWLAASLTAGFLLPAMAPTLPRFNLWAIPLVSLAGGASVVLSRQRKEFTLPTPLCSTA